MSKKIVNEILKKNFKYGTVKVSKTYMKKVVYRGRDGKMVKGIYCSHIGPLTVTSAHRDAVANTIRTLEHVLLNAGFAKNDDGWFIIEETSRSKLVLRFHEQYFPTYAYSANMDPAYKNIYLVPHYEKIKKVQ